MDRKIFYTAGCHGNFIKYLFDCYDAGKMLPTPFNENGNSHLRADTNNNMNFDVCHCYGDNASIMHGNTLNGYAIVWQGFDSFFYAMSAYTDRGGALERSGIALMEEDLAHYQDIYGTEVHIGKSLKEQLNYDMDLHGQPPRGVLRNYFLMSFYTHFNHVLWTRNNELQKTEYRKIQLSDILDANTLKSCLREIFGSSLDIDDVHETFMSRNLAYQQLQLVSSVLDDLAYKKDSKKISGLNVISEAYILFRLEVEHFDIPFHVGNDFFKNTQDIADYVDHFPGYMKRPNNLFHLHYKHYPKGKF
jgi:hypothetical protein